MTPVLTHIRVYNGRIQGGNGKYCIDAPCPDLLGYDFCCPADRFIKAVDAADGEPLIKITDGGKITLSKGKFRAILPLAPVEDYPLAERERGDEAVMLGDWIPMLKALAPFIGEDASKPWAQGIWLADDGYAYATNNSSMVRIRSPWGSTNNQLILPDFMVDEILRLGQEPMQILYTHGVITVGFEDGSWLQSRLLEGQFPEKAKQLIPVDVMGEDSAPILMALDKVRGFCPDPAFPQIAMGANGIGTLDGEMSARVEGMVFPELRWHADVLGMALKHSTEMNFDSTPCAWKGADGLMGISSVLIV
jgi:hypothetical protein